MELRKLEYFLALVDTGSFTRAAARSHVVQSTLSASVQSLETDLGARLVDRSTRSVTLTDAGRALVPEARRVLAAVRAARDAISEVAGGTRGRLRIGIMHSLPGLDLAALLSRYHAERPLVVIEPHTHPNGSAGLVADVAGDRLDLALAAVPAATGAVTVSPLTHEPIRLACPPGDEHAGQPCVPLPELAGRPFIDVPPGWGSRDSVDRLFAQEGLSRDLIITVADVATVLQLVRAGLGYALVAPSSAPAHEQTHLAQVCPTATFTVSLVTPGERPLPAAARAFVELVERSASLLNDHASAAGLGGQEGAGRSAPRPA